jgi:hypothetical protein
MTAQERVFGVLIAHRVKRGIRDMHTHCECGWVSAAQADGWYEHAGHQAEQIIAAQRRKAARTDK